MCPRLRINRNRKVITTSVNLRSCHTFLLPIIYSEIDIIDDLLFYTAAILAVVFIICVVLTCRDRVVYSINIVGLYVGVHFIWDVRRFHEARYSCCNGNKYKELHASIW